MGRSRGLEPPTPGTTNQCSNQLSYDRHGNASKTTLSCGFLRRWRHLGSGARERKRGQMNPTIDKFGYSATVIREFEHWIILLRPAQVTLGSLVLAAKSNVTAYGDLPREAFVEQGDAIAATERSMVLFPGYERIKSLMLMMVDPNVHFHVIPRYSQVRI